MVNRKTFMLVYVLVSIVQSMIFSYLTVVLTTVEKQFGLTSREAAWIYSGNEIRYGHYQVLKRVANFYK